MFMPCALLILKQFSDKKYANSTKCDKLCTKSEGYGCWACDHGNEFSKRIYSWCWKCIHRKVELYHMLRNKEFFCSVSRRKITFSKCILGCLGYVFLAHGCCVWRSKFVAIVSNFDSFLCIAYSIRSSFRYLIRLFTNFYSSMLRPKMCARKRVFVCVWLCVRWVLWDRMSAV